MPRRSFGGKESLTQAGLCFEGSPCDPRVYYIQRSNGRSAGALATYTKDILGCGEPEALLLTQRYPARCFGTSKLQEKFFTHGGTAKDHSATAT